MLKRKSMIGKAAIGVLLACGMGGCMSTTTPRWDQHFGESLAQIKAGQTLNPAPVYAEPAAGVDGAAAVRAQNNYLNSFTNPPKAVVNSTVR